MSNQKKGQNDVNTVPNIINEGETTANLEAEILRENGSNLRNEEEDSANLTAEISSDNSISQEREITDECDIQMTSDEEAGIESRDELSDNPTDSETATEDESEVEGSAPHNDINAISDDEQVERTVTIGGNATLDSDIKLYPSSPVTRDEGILKVVDLYTNDSSTTKTQLQKIIQTICDLLPPSHVMPKSVYKAFKYISRLGECNVIKHFYCKNCLHYRGLTNTQENCPACLSSLGNSAFFELDVSQQIQFLFEHKGLADIIKPFDKSKKNVDCIRDVIDGSEYIRVNSRDNRGKFDLTLFGNSDGLKLKKSSSRECYALMFTIAEVPSHLREEYMIVTGIWYDAKSPNFNSFLQPFVSKIIDGFYTGVNWVHPKTSENYNTKFTAPLFIADAPVRAELLQMSYFNGSYGCNICEIKMSRAKTKPGEKSVNAYIMNKDRVQLRTHERMELQATKSGDDAKGIKCASVLSAIPLLKLGTCVVPEYMHCVLLGGVKMFMSLHFGELKKKKIAEEKTSKKRNPPQYYIGNHIGEIDRLLLSFCPPNNFHRLPRSIYEYKSYKAYEFLNYVLFYSVPIYALYLDAKYFDHWLLFVKALHLLLQKSIKITELNEAERLLEQFVKDTEKLYGDCYLRYNIHNFLHLTLCVRRWGPLKDISTFEFENKNGYLARIIHGSKNVAQEMANVLRIVQGVEILRMKVHKRRPPPVVLRNDKCNVLGKKISYEPNDQEAAVIRAQIANFQKAKIHSRACIKCETYTSEIYKRTQTNSYNIYVHFANGEKMFATIRYFIEFKKQIFVLLRKLKIEESKKFKIKMRNNKFDHIFPVLESQELFMVNLDLVKGIEKCVRMQNYLGKRPNRENKVY